MERTSWLEAGAHCPPSLQGQSRGACNARSTAGHADMGEEAGFALELTRSPLAVPHSLSSFAPSLPVRPAGIPILLVLSPDISLLCASPGAKCWGVATNKTWCLLLEDSSRTLAAG